MNSLLHINSIQDDEMIVYRITILTYFYLQVVMNNIPQKDTLEFGMGIGPFEFAWSISLRHN